MSCPHTNLTKVIDELGMMTEQRDGTVSAPVLRAHYACTTCGIPVVHTVNLEELHRYAALHQLEIKLEHAVSAVTEAIRAVRDTGPKALPQGESE